MATIKMTVTTGMLVGKYGLYCLQLYWPILLYNERVFKISLLTVLVIGGSTWQFDWSMGFQVLGFGFGIGKHKDEN